MRAKKTKASLPHPPRYARLRQHGLRRTAAVASELRGSDEGSTRRGKLLAGSASSGENRLVIATRSHLLVRVLAVRRSDSTSVGSRLDFLAADRHSAGTDKCSATSQSGAQGMAGLVQGSRTARALQRRGSVKGRSNPTTDVWLKAVRIQNANSVHSYGIALFFRELEMPFGNMHQKC